MEAIVKSTKQLAQVMLMQLTAQKHQLMDFVFGILQELPHVRNH
jgi:hypothetical protein